VTLFLIVIAGWSPPQCMLAGGSRTTHVPAATRNHRIPAGGCRASQDQIRLPDGWRAASVRATRLTGLSRDPLDDQMRRGNLSCYIKNRRTAAHYPPVLSGRPRAPRPGTKIRLPPPGRVLACSQGSLERLERLVRWV